MVSFEIFDEGKLGSGFGFRPWDHCGICGRAREEYPTLILRSVPSTIAKLAAECAGLLSQKFAHFRGRTSGRFQTCHKPRIGRNLHCWRFPTKGMRIAVYRHESDGSIGFCGDSVKLELLQCSGGQGFPCRSDICNL